MFKNPFDKADVKKPDTKHIPRSEVMTPEAVPTNLQSFKEAVEMGRRMRKAGDTKVAVARSIYYLIKDEKPEVVHLALREACDLTEKGAITYRYLMIKESKGKMD